MSMHRRSLMASLVAIGIAVCVALPAASSGSARLDVNDVSYLWPAPASVAEVGELIAGSEPLDGGTTRLWPEAQFGLVLDTAQATRVASSAGPSFGIDFAQFKEEFKKPDTWKVVAFRADPSAPGSHSPIVAQFGSTPQLRVVLQPVTIGNGVVKVHDVTAHLAFSYITGVDPSTRKPIANKAAFAEVVKDLSALKGLAEKGGVPTAGPLGVHPGLAKRVPGFAPAVRAFLKRRLPQGMLTEMAFMGIRPPEPWIFFAMVRRPDGAFVQVAPPSIGGQQAQMLFLLDPDRVVPEPRTTNVDGTLGVSTAALFKGNAATLADVPVNPGAARPLHSDIPDIVANPRLSTVRNTDCVSCHTESTRRSSLKLVAKDQTFSFERPAQVSAVDPNVLPKTSWNVRNFGWFESGGTIHPTVTVRTANETAEAAHFVNVEYLSGGSDAPQPANNAARVELPAQKPVANALTLVMNIKSPQDFAALKALIEKIQSLPPDQNPIWKALTELATVHFARFIFLNERQLAVITTYDGSFEDYIDAFVNAIGRVFDQLLVHMADAPPLPVSDHRAEFLAYVRRHDLQAIPPFYSAYPNLSVLDILTLEKRAGGQ